MTWCRDSIRVNLYCLVSSALSSASVQTAAGLEKVQARIVIGQSALPRRGQKLQSRALRVQAWVTFCFMSLAAADMLSSAAEGPLNGPSCSLLAPSDSALCKDLPCTGETAQQNKHAQEWALESKAIRPVLARTASIGHSLFCK